MIATTQDQSQRLLRCGVSADTADMYISNYGDLWASPFKDNQRKNEKGFVPAWSLSALMTKILPHDIFDNEIDYSLFLQRQRSEDNTPTWELSYYNLEYDATLLFVEVADPIEAAVQMAEKLTANDYKLNEQ